MLSVPSSSRKAVGPVLVLATLAALSLYAASGHRSASSLTRVAADADGSYMALVAEHGTPSFDAWHKMFLSYIDPATNFVNLPPLAARYIYAKRSDGGVIGTVFFNTPDMKGIQTLYNQSSPMWKAGRKEGWLLDPWKANYFTPGVYYSASKDGIPPWPLPKGTGIIFGGHALGAGFPFKAWAAPMVSGAFQAMMDSVEIFASIAGPAACAANTDITCSASPDKSGIGVMHFTKTVEEAKTFVGMFNEMWPTLPRAQFPGDYYMTYGEVTDDLLAPSLRP